jgi:hypothetical protein
MLVDWDKYHNLDIERDRATGVEFVHVLQWLAKKVQLYSRPNTIQADCL